MSRGLESLEVWQRARKLAVHICKEILPALPPLEKWSLVEQLRRSTQSIPANIVEGFGRYCYQESIRYGYIARGSLEETTSHLCLAKDLGYISEESFEYVESELKN